MIIEITDADSISAIVIYRSYFLGPNKGRSVYYKQVCYTPGSSTQFGRGFTEYEKVFNEIKRK